MVDQEMREKKKASRKVFDDVVFNQKVSINGYFNKWRRLVIFFLRNGSD